MITQRQIYVGKVCCASCFKLDQDEAFIRGIMLTRDGEFHCGMCFDNACSHALNHAETCDKGYGYD